MDKPIFFIYPRAEAIERLIGYGVNRKAAERAVHPFNASATRLPRYEDDRLIGYTLVRGDFENNVTISYEPI